MIPGLKPGESEQDPAVWIAALRTALAAALREAAIDPGRVIALGVSGQQHGFVPLGPDGVPLRPAKLWNDTSTVAENDALVAALGGPAACIAKLGLVPAVGFTASKILWLKRHEPERFARLTTVLLPHNYLNYVLTGEVHMEYGDASGTGLLDIRRRTWQIEAVAAVDEGLMSRLPAVAHPEIAAGRITREFASDFGLQGRPGRLGRRRQHDGRHRHGQRRARRLHGQPGDVRDDLLPASTGPLRTRAGRSPPSATARAAGCPCSAP